MISVSFSIFRYTEDWGMHYKTIPSVLISDNHSLVNSFNFSPLGNNSTRLSKKKRETFAASRNQLHHSVTFYFTVLSEPSQDSSLGHFLFYRPVRTVTGLINDEEEHFCSYFYYIHLFYKYQYVFKIL